MPLAKPQSGEGRDAFLTRCMKDAVMLEEYPQNGQRYAVCVGQWDKTHAIARLEQRLELMLERHQQGKPTEPEWRRLRRIIDRAEPRLQRVFLRAISRTVSASVRAEIEAAVRAGDTARAVAAIPWDTVGAKVFQDEGVPILRQIVADAGEVSAGLLQIPGGYDFTVDNPRIMAWLDEHAAKLITDFGGGNRGAVKAAMRVALEEGMSATEAVPLIRQSVGLTERMAAAVAKTRRDVGAAAANQQAAHLRNARALMIARTESTFATTGGQLEAWEQAREDGLFHESRAVRVWITTPDDLADHAPPSCADLDGAEAPYGEGYSLDGSPLFDATGAPLMGPPLHPNCRCSQSLRTEG